MKSIKDLFRQPKVPKIKIIGTDGMSPEQIKVLEDQYRELLLNGRPLGLFAKTVREQMLTAGRGAPLLIADEKTGTITVPANFEGLVVLVANWDSMLLPEELQAVRDVVGKMIPMGLNQQHVTRKERAEAKEALEHMKEHHPEDWEAAQGWRV